MKNAIKLFLMDIKRTAKTPAALVLVIGLMILPSFYAWFNLAATWDPPSNTDQIKIAVVNEDDGDTVNDKEINVGDDIEDEIRKDDNFDWRFMSREKADQELHMGRVYAAIYLPKDFTHEITGTLRKDPQQAKVLYKVNQKLNAIVPGMTEAGTSALVSKANDTFNETVTGVLFDKANELGLSLEDQIPAYDKLRDGVFRAQDALPNIERFRQAIINLNNNQDQLDEKADQFRNLENYKDEAVNALERLNQLNASVPAINERAQLVVSLDRMMPNIERALQTVHQAKKDRIAFINDGVDLAIAGTQKGLQDLNDASERLPVIEARVNAFGEVIDRAQTANNDFANALNNNQTTNNAVQTTPQSSQGTDYKVTPLSTSNDVNLDPLPDGRVITEEDANAMTSAYSSALEGVNSAAKSQVEAAQKDIKAAENISYGVMGASQPDSFKQPLTHIITRMNHTSKFLRDYRDFLDQVEQQEGIDLTDAQQKLSNSQDDISQVTKRLNALNDAITSGNSGEREAIDVVKGLDDISSRFNATGEVIKNDIRNALLNVSDGVATALNNGEATIDTVQTKLQGVQNIIRLGQTLLSEGNERLTQLSDTLPAIESAYISAMDAAEDYFPVIRDKVSRASDFVQNDLPALESRLNSATETANEKLPEAFNRYDQMRQLLDNNQDRAKQALSNLADFAQNEMPSVEDKIQKADDVFQELEDNNTLEELIDLLQNDLKEQADVIANPIDIQSENVFPVKNNGSASAPFYTALSIWVGALLLVSLLTVDNKHESLQPYLTIRQTYLGKMGLFLMINIIQAIVVSSGDILIFHADVESIPLFIGICAYSAVIFTSIVYTLVSIFGNPGKAMAIIYLILQIAGGGGTYPVEITPKFFQTIHPFLPFSYSIDALREAVGGPVPEILVSKLLILGIFGIVFFLIGLIGKPLIDPFTRKVTKKAEQSKILE